LLAANGSQSLQFVPALLNRMLATTPLLSVAESVRVTAGLVVKAAAVVDPIGAYGWDDVRDDVRSVAEPLTVNVALNRPKVV